MARHARIGIALGSGSARGWSHIGVLETLSAAGIEPEIVCGTSMGALVGAAYVTGHLSELARWAGSVTWREIVSLLDVRLAGGGLIDGKLIVEFLRELGIKGPIESCAKRFAAVATDLASGREVWLQSGPIDEAVRASISLPGIFRPAQIDDRRLVDGGLINPVPVSVCRALGAQVIIAVNLNGDLVGRRFEDIVGLSGKDPSNQGREELIGRLLAQIPAGIREQVERVAPKLLRPAASTPGYFDVLANSINIMQDQITRTRLAGEPPHVLLMPRLQRLGLMQFNRAKEAIAEGRACAEQALPAIKRFL